MIDSGGVLQEVHFFRTPYVFVLDIPKVPENTRFDVIRLVKPERQAVLQKVNEKQEFGGRRVDLKQIKKLWANLKKIYFVCCGNLRRKLIIIVPDYCPIVFSPVF